MRKRVAGFLAVGAMALSTVVAMAAPAAAVPPWTITPGGAADGEAGQTDLVVHDPMFGDITLSCESSTVDVDLESGVSTDNQLGTIPEEPGIQFNVCLLAGFIQFEVDQVGEWTLNGDTYDSTTGTTTGTIDDIEANISGPGCEATVAGSVDVTYVNSTDTLTVIDNPTLTITDVDINNNCSGLIHETATAEFTGAYEVTPGQDITG